MCCNTKLKIAQALRELMAQRPLNKITVQDLMESAQRKRQSFYYYFQDIYDVLSWICERQLGDPLREEPDLDFEEWCLRALTLVEQDRVFYRRMFAASNPELSRDFCQSLVRPRMSRLLFLVDDPRILSRQQAFVVDFYTKAIAGYFTDLAASRRPLDWVEVKECLHSLLGVLRPTEDICLQTQAG